MAEDRQPFRQDSLDVPPPGVDQPVRKRHEERRPAPEQDARRRRAQQQRRRNSVFQYIAILFMAAFALLLYTFMMERRQNQQQIDELKQSASTVQTLQGLMEENAQLQAQVNELEQDLKAEQSAYSELQVLWDGLTDTHSHLEHVHERTVEAMEVFWQLNDAYVRGRFNQCKELITLMETEKLVEYLPQESTVTEDFRAPADRYQEIYDRVMN